MRKNCTGVKWISCVNGKMFLHYLRSVSIIRMTVHYTFLERRSFLEEWWNCSLQKASVPVKSSQGSHYEICWAVRAAYLSEDATDSKYTSTRTLWSLTECLSFRIAQFISKMQDKSVWSTLRIHRKSTTFHTTGSCCARSTIGTASVVVASHAVIAFVWVMNSLKLARRNWTKAAASADWEVDLFIEHVALPFSSASSVLDFAPLCRWIFCISFFVGFCLCACIFLLAAQQLVIVTFRS